MLKYSLHNNQIWQLRAVQLDLARQMETIEYIKSFIDFAADYDFNYLVLYLEGRIKTKSFPFDRHHEYYTPEDIKQIVAYAGEKGMEVIPVVSMLGHADIFFKYSELESLAELRNDRQGRFSKHKHVFCPSQPETISFLTDYIKEVSELFPSKYFHAGFDEAWDIGYCDLCRERLKSEKQAGIFAKHLLACYEIVTKLLKKVMIIWDDMFDLYPQVIDQLPRDIIMCAWQYDSLVEMPQGHCGGPRIDKLKLYEKLGFRSIFAPTVFSMRNVETFSAYASGKEALGALLTSWELEKSFLFSDYPTVAYAGMLWSGKYNNCPADEAIAELTGCTLPEQLVLLKNILNYRDARLYSDRQMYLRGPLSEAEYDRRIQVIAVIYILKERLDEEPSELHRTVLEDMLVTLEEEAVYLEMRQVLSELYLGVVSGENRLCSKQKIDDIGSRLMALKNSKLQQWNKYRPGIDSGKLELYFNPVINMLEDSWNDSKQVCGLVRVRFLFSLANVSFYIKWQGDENWDKITSKRISHQPQQGFSQYIIPVYRGGIPIQIKIEVSGFAGAGITYTEFINKRNEHFIPCAVAPVGGKVEKECALLEDGLDWCCFGDWEQDARRKFLEPELAEAVNAVEIKLKKQEISL